MLKTENVEVLNSFDIFFKKVLKLVPKNKIKEVEDLSVAFRCEFPVSQNDTYSWSKERREAAKKVWDDKRNEVKFWIRGKSGKVKVVNGIENAAKELNLKSNTLNCYLSTGSGKTTRRGITVSKLPLQELTQEDLAEQWAQEFYNKNGIWPTEDMNPLIKKGYS